MNYLILAGKSSRRSMLILWICVYIWYLVVKPTSAIQFGTTNYEVELWRSLVCISQSPFLVARTRFYQKYERKIKKKWKKRWYWIVRRSKDPFLGQKSLPWWLLLLTWNLSFFPWPSAWFSNAFCIVYEVCMQGRVSYICTP